MRTSLIGASTVILLATVVNPLGAQTPAGQPPAGTTPAFVVQTDNGDNRVQFGAIVHVDGRFAVGDLQQAVLDTFTVRRFRAVTQGRVARYIEFFLNVDFAGGAVNVRDAYFDTVVAPPFRVRLGKMKVPFSYDRNILVVNLIFVERGFTTTVAPDRDTGVQVLGDLAGNVVSYGVSLTNGVADGGSSDLDANSSKDVAGRVVIRPWARAKNRLNGLGIALAASTGKQAGALPSFQSAARQTYFSYSAATAADGRRTRYSPQAFYYRGPFGAYGEYVHSRGGIVKSGAGGDVDHEAWQVAASWVVTGERRASATCGRG
jgi:phosphate-selective porin OprO/OprP